MNFIKFMNSADFPEQRGPGPQATVCATRSDTPGSSGRKARTRSRIISTTDSPTGMRRKRVWAAISSSAVKT